MAQFVPALTFLLDNEDSQRHYASVPDVGGMAIAGINSNSWPVQYARISQMDQEDRPTAVADFYRLSFWNPMELDGLASQDLANRVFDAGVNEGMGTATRLLQQAAVQCGAAIKVDGFLGPETLKAVNACAPGALLDTFRNLRTQRYRDIVKKNPASAQYLHAWEVRASL